MIHPDYLRRFLTTYDPEPEPFWRNPFNRPSVGRGLQHPSFFRPPQPEPEPVFRPKTWDQMFAGKAMPNVGEAQPFPETAQKSAGSVPYFGGGFRRKSMDEILEGKGTPRGGVASMTPIPEPGSVAAMNAEADAAAAKGAGTGQVGSGTGGREQTSSSRPIWNRVPITPPLAPEPSKFVPWWGPPRTAQIDPANPAPQPTGIDTTTGAPFWQRAAAGVKTTPEGKTSYLESVYGKGSVITRPDGEVAYLNPGTGRWTQFDEKGAGWGDIADFSGDAIEQVPRIAATAFPPAKAFSMTPGGAAIFSGAGNLFRQTVSGALPGEDYPQGGLSEVGGRLSDAALSAGTGGLGQKGANITFGQLRGILSDPAKRATLSPATIAALGSEAGMKFGEKTAANLTPELLDWLVENSRPGWE